MTALYLERYLNFGLSREELQSGKPIIGIAQTGSDLSPCNRHHIELAKRVRERIAAYSFLKASDGLDIRLTASIGVATLPDVAASAEELVKAQEEWQRRLEACPEEHRPFLVLQYATPVRNQYRVKAGLPLYVVVNRKVCPFCRVAVSTRAAKTLRLTLP